MDLPVQLVEMQPTAAAWPPSQHSLLARWHLLSLDAPSVAVAWTCFVAKAAHVPLAPAIPAAMFLAVWIVYAADRLLDGLASTDICEPRHRFHHRHRRLFLLAIAAATALLIPLTLAIPSPDLKLYFSLAGLLVLWFCAVHLRNSRLPKEVLPGLFCAAAAFIPVWRDHLVAAPILYATLITLNCWCIYSWEHDSLTHVHISTRFGIRWLRELHLVTILASLTAAAFAPPNRAPIFIAVALSTALLIALDCLRDRFNPTDLRAAADLVLLTPLLFLPTLR